MAQRPSFDMSKMSMGTKGALATGILLFIALFFPWFKADVPGGALFGVDIPGVSGWSGIGVVAGIAAVALIVWEGLSLAGVNVNAPKKLITAILAGTAAAFTLLRFLIKPSGGFGVGIKYSFGAWLGLILALAMLYAAWINFQESKTAAPPPAAGGGGFTA